MKRKRVSRLSKYLISPTPPKNRGTRPKSYGKVLTSAKSIELMEEKERLKQEKLNEKEQRKLQREENRKKKESELKLKTTPKLRGIVIILYG